MRVWPFAAHANSTKGAFAPILADLLEAWENGLWCFVVCENEIVALERPQIHTRGGQLHREDGPAVYWPSREAWPFNTAVAEPYYFWRGVHVQDPEIITHPERITVEAIDKERNAEIKRIMVERYGYERFMKDGGGIKVHEDEFGILWRRPLTDKRRVGWGAPGEEVLMLVEVVNGTPEPDGSIKHYWLRVPPTVRTAREAVAWTYGLSADQYKPKVRT